jgi:hypothetical protein
MAVVNTASAVLTNITSSPPKVNDARTAGRNFQKRGIVTAVAGDSIASHYGFFRLPAEAVLVSCEVSTPAQGGATAGDLGLWEVSSPFLPVTQAGSVANAKQFFVAALSLVAASTKAQQAFANATFWTVANADQTIWKMLGLTTDPPQGTPIGSTEYDVVLTLTAAVTTGGAILVEISYKMP